MVTIKKFTALKNKKAEIDFEVSAPVTRPGLPPEWCSRAGNQDKQNQNLLKIILVN